MQSIPVPRPTCYQRISPEEDRLLSAQAGGQPKAGLLDTVLTEVEEAAQAVGVQLTKLADQLQPLCQPEPQGNDAARKPSPVGLSATSKRVADRLQVVSGRLQLIEKHLVHISQQLDL